MKKERQPFRPSEPQYDQKRPSQRDDFMDEARKLMEPKSQFAAIRQDQLSRNLKKK